MPSTIAASTSVTNASQAAESLVEQARRAGLSRIRGVLAYATVDLDVASFSRALSSALPGVPVAGTTTCQQLATDAGAGMTAGALFLGGEGFRVGASLGADDGDAKALGRRLVEQALADASMSVSDARFVVVQPTPGIEDAFLEGVTAAIGDKVPVIGGTAADNDLSGRWQSFGGGTSVASGASVLVCDWPWKISLTYQSGYLATSKRGVITKARGRKIIAIDGKPAAEVYAGWRGGPLPVEENVLGVTTLKPLGVVRGTAAGLELHVVIHPERAHRDGSISTFAEVKEGEAIVLMESSKSSLIRRGASVARFALTQSRLRPDDIVGQLIVYCAGCSLALGDAVGEMAAGLSRELKAPFVMPFTFGEQGCITRGRVDHGNLMCSALLLSNVP